MKDKKQIIMEEIEDLEEQVRVDEQLSYGNAPAGAYDDIYQKIDKLQEELARIEGHTSFMDYIMSGTAEKELPFI